jgi:hypothetical protein
MLQRSGVDFDRLSKEESKERTKVFNKFALSTFELAWNVNEERRNVFVVVEVLRTFRENKCRIRRTFECFVTDVEGEVEVGEGEKRRSKCK